MTPLADVMLVLLIIIAAMNQSRVNGHRHGGHIGVSCKALNADQLSSRSDYE